MIREIKKAVRNFERIMAQTAGTPKKKQDKTKPETKAEGLEEQVNKIMSLPADPDEAAATPKKKLTMSRDRDLSRILRYTLREPCINVAFFAGLVVCYSRNLLKRAQNKLDRLTRSSPSKPMRVKVTAKKSGTKPEGTKEYLRLGRNKVYSLLVENNVGPAEEVRDYKAKYYARHPSPAPQRSLAKSRKKK